jgi:hypothetical protein
MRAGTALLSLPSKRPHPTFVETTLPQYGRLVKGPAFLLMYLLSSFQLDDLQVRRVGVREIF